LGVAACAPRRIALPSDPGVPFPDVNQVHSQISAACTAVRTLTAELGLAGRAGDQRLRGRVVAGFARPDSMRLEGVAPFGSPAFILAARGNTATLVLPRDNRVLRGTRAEDILGALTGVALAPADLQAILAGCVTPMPRAVGGRLHQNGWASIDLDGGATVYLQRMGNAWQVRAAKRAGWQIEYPAWQGMFPQVVRLRSDAQAGGVDLSATISQLETNVDLDASAFTVNVPPGTTEITLDELRKGAPLGQ
jgi:outer membrane biogenesis lipoprotein LolB